MQMFDIEYIVWSDGAGCLVKKTERVEAEGRRAAWKKLKDKIHREYDREWLAGHHKFWKIGIQEVKSP